MVGNVPADYMPVVATQLPRRHYSTVRGAMMTSDERREIRYQNRKRKRDEKRKERIGEYDNFERIALLDSLVDAYNKSRRGVSWKASVQRYGMNLLKNVSKSHDDMMAGKDVSQGFIEFDICERGKPRHIKSMHFRERCVQRTLCDNSLVPVLQRGLIYDNGASLEGKGLHFSIDRLKAHLHRYYRTNGFSNEGYVAVIDFSSYFDNILHDKVYEILERNFEDKRIVNLCKQFVEPFGDKSLGIGSQISQILAIAYPNRIDHFVKQELGIKFYGRYMDDSYLIHRDKEYLKECMERLYVEYEKLGIKVNRRKTQIVKLSRGFTFLQRQHILLPSGKLIEKPSHSSIVRMRRKLKKFARFVADGSMTVDEVRFSYRSWRGFIEHTNSYRTVKSMDALFNKLFSVFP